MSYRPQNLKKITQHEIEVALKRYLDKGGSIKHIESQGENPSLNYDAMENEERNMVYEITGLKNTEIKIN